MAEFDYKPNSHKSKEQTKEVSDKGRSIEIEKVANGQVRKKSEISKLAKIFISEDVSNVKNYVFMDVLVPAIKKAISDIVTNGVDMILYGGNGRSGSRSKADGVSYRNYYDKNRDDRHASRPASANRFSYDEVDFKTRGEAESVLVRMEEIIDRYDGYVTVGEFYDLADVTNHNYMNRKYGWTNLSTAEIARTYEGRYIIKLPRALPID